MFKRRIPRSSLATVGRALWPRGGWVRAARYMVYRLRRLPDPAYKISRGIACGVFVCFTPLFGLHFVVAIAMAWLIGGNLLAALLATFFGNPITFPVIAGLSVGLGSWLMGMAHPLPLGQTFDSFSRVSVELWYNFQAIFTPEPARWLDLQNFFSYVFMPYMFGGVIIGTPVAVGSYMLSRPVIAAYQRTRISRLKKRFAKRRETAQEITARRQRESGI